MACIPRYSPIPAFSRNLRKETGKSARYYFLDTGVRNAVINNFNTTSKRWILLSNPTVPSGDTRSSGTRGKRGYQRYGAKRTVPGRSSHGRICCRSYSQYSREHNGHALARDIQWESLGVRRRSNLRVRGHDAPGNRFGGPACYPSGSGSSCSSGGSIHVRVAAMTARMIRTSESIKRRRRVNRRSRYS
jgi:hypothetical protein